MKIKIKQYLNTNEKEVESKKYNIWIGISLGNKYFNKENIKQYVLWALGNTKEDVLIVIADRIHAINLEVMDKYSKLGAFRRALRLGDEKEGEIKEIIKSLPEEKQKLIKVAKWKEVTTSKYHDYRVEVLFEEFRKNKEFHRYIIRIIKENSKISSKNLSNEKLDRLAEYVLYEIPVYLNGAKYGGLPEYGGKTYLLQIYPGLGLIDTLLIGLQEGKLFPKLTKKLKITDKIAILEGYVE